MKSYTFKKLILVYIILSTQAFTQAFRNDAYLSNIDKLTLQEVKEYLVNDQKSMEKFIGLAENNNLRFSLSTSETTRPIFNKNPYKILDTNESKVKIDKFFSDTYIRQYINYPKSEILLHLDSYKMEDIYG